MPPRRNKQWTTPAPNPGTPARQASDCHDRQSHGLPVGQGTLTVSTRRYRNPCSNNPNNLAPPVVGPPHYMCAGVAGHTIPGVPQTHGAPGAADSVCHHCRDNVERMQWYKLALSRMLRPPPLVEGPRWAGFWTRMCADCEIAEQLLLNTRQWWPGNGAILGSRVIPAVARRNTMANYPFNTCTCIPTLTQRDSCMRHTAVKWLTMRRPPGPAGPQPEERVAIRNRNKAFLTDLRHENATGRDCFANAARRATRMLNGQYGACRCGQEVVPHANMSYVQCMACEGIWQLNALNVMLPPTPAQNRNSANSSGGNRRYALARGVPAGRPQVNT